MLASYGGHLKHAAAMKCWEELWVKHRWLVALLDRRAWSFAERWSRRRLSRARSYHAHYWALARHAGSDGLVFFRFIEFYGPQRYLAVRVLGLRSAALRRANYAFTAGFPRLYAAYLLRASSEGFVVIVVREKPAWRNLPFATRLPCDLPIPLGREPFLRPH